MLGSPAGPAGPSQRGLWPLAPAPASSASFTADGFSKYGVYSLFPGGPTFGSALYSHASTFGRFGHLQTSSGNPFHAQKVSDSLFSSSGYTFGAPTPPPGSPYSPVHVTQLELLAKGFNSNIIIQQPDFPLSPKKPSIQEKRCEDKCCNLKPQKPCSCLGSPTKAKYSLDNGCSRTNPVDWNPVNVKKEPGANPCQVAEITTSVSPVVKVEVTSPTQKGTDVHLGSIVAQNDPTPGMAANTTGGVATGGTLLQCTDDRMGGWPMSATPGSALSTPTLWQYPAPVPVEPMVPLPVPMPPVGFQLIRDPATGGLLLLPTTTGLEQLQQAVVWPSYPQPSSHVLLPPLPPPPLQLLSTASSDYLSTSTTLHQHHTQTHSTRLVAVTTDTKRKIPLPIPATTLIKIETDATLDQTKALQAVSTIGNNTGTVFTDPSMTPLVTTHVIYQHPTNLILSQPPTSEPCRSRATSPETLTPPPETLTPPEEETLGVQDASNQTDTPICSEDDTNHPQEEHRLKIVELENEEIEAKAVEEKCVEIPNEIVENELNETLLPSPKPVEPEPQTVPPKPDISGLELLSNSIVELENSRQTLSSKDGLKNEETPVQPKITEQPKPMEDGLGGLDLLCALAEQRILEEGSEKIKKEKTRESKKHKSKRHPDEPKHKRSKHEREERERRKHNKYYNIFDENQADENIKPKCSCKENFREFKSVESQEEVRKFVASKSQTTCCKGDWPCMNAMELDMRMRLADLQRQYREKQKELSKLKPKKHELKKSRSRKKSSHSDRSLTPPPLLDKMDTPLKQNRTNQDLLKPPTLCAENIKIAKLDTIKQVLNIKLDHESHKRHCSPGTDTSDSTPEKYSSSKKRKVGRPKKLLSSSGLHIPTETIVAKKPKKGNIVGYLLAAKEKLKLQNKNGLVYSSSPPRYTEEVTKQKHKNNKAKNNGASINKQVIEEYSNSSEKSSKMRPKLKAEATVKSYNEDEDARNGWETEDEPEEDDNTVEDMEIEEPLEKETTDVTTEEKTLEEAKVADVRCILTAEHLEIDKLRVLTSMGGLFYAGQLNALEPPDVYSITLDGERGNRPHIMSREEILRDAIVEVSPGSTGELTAGTRLCAYWSQQYRCLYPGSVAEPGTPDPVLDSKFVSVEFDDGDSGRIALEDIRLLPPDYPIIEYDPNPLLSLSKRRRRTSTCTSTEERRSSQSSSHPVEVSKAPELPTLKENEDPQTTSADAHRERKRLKKKKREKLKQKLHEEKKKKKHKCTEEDCKHKKHHKKHKKHKKHHHKEEREDETGVVVEQEESSAGCSATTESFDDYEDITNPEDEVTMDDIIEANNKKKSKKLRDRQESCESRSKMSAFLPARQLWGWAGKGYKRARARGRSRKQFFKSIQRGKEMITVGDCAVFLSTGRPDRPFIGRIEAMWELCSTMIVKVKWFYHPEETNGCPLNMQYPGALFESPHIDENDVQTISHKCEVLPLKDYIEKLGDDPQRYATIYDNNDIYYLAGYYDPTTNNLKMEPGIPFSKTD